MWFIVCTVGYASVSWCTGVYSGDGGVPRRATTPTLFLCSQRHMPPRPIKPAPNSPPEMAPRYTAKPRKSHKKVTSIGVAGYKPDGSWHNSSRNLSRKQATQHNKVLQKIGETHFLRYRSGIGSPWQGTVFIDEVGCGYDGEDDGKDDDDDNWEDVVQRIISTMKGENKRKKDETRMALAANWDRIEIWMASYQLQQSEKVIPCECKGFYDIEVNLISFGCKSTGIISGPSNVLT